MTVRERIKAVQIRLRDGDAAPPVIRGSLMELTGLLPNVMAEAREADHAYNLVLRKELESGEKAVKAVAEIRARTSPEYQRLREADDAYEFCLETIRSCKVYLRSLDEEMRLAQ